MLYVSTRNDFDTVPAGRALRENRDPDGGFYVPFRTEALPDAQIRELLAKPFNECVAEVLNLLLQCRLTGWDVDFAAGRYPVRLNKAGRRTYVAELWHNPDWNYERMVFSLTQALCPDNTAPTSWGRIAIRIAVMFGIFGQLRRDGVYNADICAVAGDFSAPISAWYARQMGLPIGNIVCACNENHALWDLICHGQMRTNSLSIQTLVPEADVAIPQELERLIYACGGREETDRYQACCRLGQVYAPGEEVLAQLRTGLYVSVVSSKRLENTIPGVYRTHGYVLSPACALAYAALQDYRAKTGVSRHAVVLSEQSPACTAETVAVMLDVTPEVLIRDLL